MHEREAEAEPDPEPEEVAIFVAIKHPGIQGVQAARGSGWPGSRGEGRGEGRIPGPHKRPPAGEKRSGDLVWTLGDRIPWREGRARGLPGGGGKAERRNLPSPDLAREGAHHSTNP